jgi:hypothetical protein
MSKSKQMRLPPFKTPKKLDFSRHPNQMHTLGAHGMRSFATLTNEDDMSPLLPTEPDELQKI